MKNKCLVTKLNGTVDNENLFKFGELRINVDTDIEEKPVHINVGGFKDITITVTGDLSIWNWDKTTNYGSNFHYKSHDPQDATSVLIKGSNGYISIVNKYTMFDNAKHGPTIYDTINDNTLKSITYWFKSKNIKTEKVGGKSNVANKMVQRSGDLSELASLTNLESINVGYSPNITGKLEDVAIYKDTLKRFIAYGTPITGSIESLGECTLLNELNLHNSPALNNISGTVENFVARQRVAGRTTAEFDVLDVGDTNVTFNGHLVTTYSRNNFSWTENTITLNGETINA